MINDKEIHQRKNNENNTVDYENKINHLQKLIVYKFNS